MSLLKFKTINEFKQFLDEQIKTSEKELSMTSKTAGEKLRNKEKELGEDKEFLLIKEKLEEKTDDKKKTKTKKQISANWINYDLFNLYNGMGAKGELEIYFKEIENLKSKIEKQKAAKLTLENLISKGLKNNLNCLVYENDDKFDMVLLKTTEKVHKKFSFKQGFSVSAKLEKPLFVGSALK